MNTTNITYNIIYIVGKSVSEKDRSWHMDWNMSKGFTEKKSKQIFNDLNDM